MLLSGWVIPKINLYASDNDNNEDPYSLPDHNLNFCF